VLKERTHALYGMEDCTYDYFENVKDEPRHEFYGLTPRRAYQAVSEQLMKPLHGNDIYGKILADQFVEDADEMGWPDLITITDSGFRDEAVALIARFEQLKQNDKITLVRLHRNGCTFEGDTRSYIDLTDEGVPGVDLSNDGPREELWDKLVDAVPQIRRMAM
jgi:hypothetical protein